MDLPSFRPGKPAREHEVREEAPDRHGSPSCEWLAVSRGCVLYIDLERRKSRKRLALTLSPERHASSDLPAHPQPLESPLEPPFP
jgi:hypothetical protein